MCIKILLESESDETHTEREIEKRTRTNEMKRARQSQRSHSIVRAQNVGKNKHSYNETPS